MPIAQWPGRQALRDHGWAALGLLVLCGFHGWICWLAMGGWSGLRSEWPLLQADHGFHYSHAILSRGFLSDTGFSAGYDPSFMAGFPMSVISGTSTTLFNVAMLLGGTTHPAVVYKLTVWACLALTPCLVAWAGILFGLSLRGSAWSTLLFLLYFWTDFPVNYAGFGMVTFMLGVPTSLVAVALLARYLERGGWRRWLGAGLACSVTFFVHLTSSLVVGVAGLAAYGHAAIRARSRPPGFPLSRHCGFWSLPLLILPLNAFWWLPGYWLRATMGDTKITFAHPEPVTGRLLAIFWNEAAIEPILIGLGLMGLSLLSAARPIAASGLGGIIAAGFGWGYLAGAFRSLDGLQPGRQTYACYSGLCLAAGFGLGELLTWLQKARPGRFDRWVSLALVLALVRIFGPATASDWKSRIFAPIPFLSSLPPPSLVRLIDNLHRHVKPGERLLYEETGLGIPGLADPFAGRHFSPVLPSMTGVEVLGGPYLHTPVTTNFTQFGEGKLFGVTNWNRADFVRYARLYRPTAIACWTPKARAFCRDNPDLIQTLVADPEVLLGRVIGFEGATIRGQATVDASPNRLVVRDLVADPADGLVVLRYHLTPCLVADPPLSVEPIYLEQDPVPFIGLRPNQPGPVTIQLILPPKTGQSSGSKTGG